MKFHKLTDTCKPEPNREVIVRIAGDYDQFADKVIPIAPYLYIVVRRDFQTAIDVYDDDGCSIIGWENHDVYTETACGGDYASWLDCEISHWCYATDILEEIEETL